MRNAVSGSRAERREDLSTAAVTEEVTHTRDQNRRRGCHQQAAAPWHACGEEADGDSQLFALCHNIVRAEGLVQAEAGQCRGQNEIMQS